MWARYNVYRYGFLEKTTEGSIKSLLWYTNFQSGTGNADRYTMWGTVRITIPWKKG